MPGLHRSKKILFPPPVQENPVPVREEWAAPIHQEQGLVPPSSQVVMATPVENTSKLFQPFSAKFVESSVPEEKPSAPRYIRSYFEPGFVPSLPPSM